MKILYLLSQRPDSTGSGFYVQAVMEQAADAGHTCALVAGISGDDIIQPKLPPENIFPVRFDGADLPFPIPGMSDVMPYKSTRFIDMDDNAIEAYKNCFRKKITDAVNTFKPDIIHCNHLWIMTAITRELFPKIPLIASCHGTDLRQLKNCRHLKRSVINSCRKADRIIALSQTQKKEIGDLLSISDDQISVAGIGFNDKRFYHAEKPPPSPVKILYAGKLSEAKGVPWLLQAIKKIEKSPLSFHLCVAGAGTGKDYDKCISLSEEVREHVTFYGALKQENLAELMRESHIFVLPSFFEGLPLVLFEALASGCRVITTSLPGAREILQNVSEDFVKFIHLPKLRTIDSPFKSDMPWLVENLAEIMMDMITQCTIKPDLKSDDVEKMTAAYTWKEVYQRVEKAYFSSWSN